MDEQPLHATSQSSDSVDLGDVHSFFNRFRNESPTITPRYVVRRFEGVLFNIPFSPRCRSPGDRRDRPTRKQMGEGKMVNPLISAVDHVSVISTSLKSCVGVEGASSGSDHHGSIGPSRASSVADRRRDERRRSRGCLICSMQSHLRAALE